MKRQSKAGHSHMGKVANSMANKPGEQKMPVLDGGLELEPNAFLAFERSGEARNRFGDLDQYKAIYKRRITLAPDPWHNFKKENTDEEG